MGVNSANMNKTAIKQAVKAAGGRKPLADLLGVSVSSVIKWERGERTARPEKAVQIEAMFGIPREQLMPALFRRVVEVDHVAR